MTKSEEIKILQKRKEKANRVRIVPLGKILEEIIEKKGKNNKKNVPGFDPEDGGVEARCLFLHEAPGKMAYESGYITCDNCDKTAKNFHSFIDQTRIKRKDIIIWNAVPWCIWKKNKMKIRHPKPKEMEEGMEYFLKLRRLCVKLEVIVLMGNTAQRAWCYYLKEKPDIRIFLSPHPSPQFINKDKDNREKMILNVFEEVGEFLYKRSKK